MLLLSGGCGGGLRSSESAHMLDVAQLQVYDLQPDGRELVGMYHYDFAVGVTQQDQPVLVEQLTSALHGSVDASSIDPADFKPQYAISAGDMVIAIDFNRGIAEIAYEDEKRLVNARPDVAGSLQTLIEGKTLTGS